MIFIKESKTEQLVPCKVGKKIAFLLLEKFFDSQNCIEEDGIWLLFEMKYLVDKKSRGIHN